MYKAAKLFFRKELLRPRAELDDKNLSYYGWKLGKDLEGNEAETTIGLCDPNSKTISFSSKWLDNASPAFYQEVVLHEIAHAILDTIGYSEEGYPPHNNKWRYLAKKLGCKYGARIPVKKTLFGKSIIKE